MQRDFFKQIPVIAKRVSRQQIVVAGKSIGKLVKNAQLRDNHDFRQRKGDTLPQLVVTVQRIPVPDIKPVQLQFRLKLRQRQAPEVRQLQ